MNFFAVFIGCGLGGLARWGVARWAVDHVTSALPAGTILVNVFGSFLMGFFFAAFKDSLVPMPARLMVTTGFLGGFTTFSTFALETVLLVEKREMSAAAANFLLQNVLGLLGVVVGVLTFLLLRKVISDFSS